MKTAQPAVGEEVQGSQNVVVIAAALLQRVARRHRIVDEIAQNRMNRAHVADMMQQYGELIRQLDTQYVVLQKSLTAR